MTSGLPDFSSYFDRTLMTAAGEETRFGRDVLQGLIDGIRKYREEQPRSRWIWGTGVIACAMAADDQGLLDELARCESTCLVVTKQEQYRYGRAAFQRLEAHAARAQGLAQQAFPELSDLAPLADGKPFVVGPYGPVPEADVSAVRELGFRKIDNKLVPILHAKVALVGDMCWTDEHPSGHVVDEIYFSPKQLWVASANFTQSSRRSLEFSTWLTDAGLLTAARSFLLKLVANSEPLRSAADTLVPEFAPVEYDDAAFIDYLREMGPWPEDQDE